MSASRDNVSSPKELDTLIQADQSQPSDPDGACAEDGVAKEPGDGGNPFDRGPYCWVVAVACFVGQFMAYPLGHCYGLFNIALLQQFGVSKAETALVGSLCTGLTAGWAAVSGIIANRIGHRLTCMIGSLLTATGFLISSFAQDIRVLYFSYGIMIGIGTAMMDLPTLLMISFYFEKYRNILTGVIATGLGLGALTLPLIINESIEKYSWRVTMVILAAMALQGCIVGTLIKPNQYLKKEKKDASAGEETFSWSLFRKWTLIALLVIMFTYGVADGIFYITVPHRVVLMGFTTDKVALLLSIAAAAFIVSTAGLGLLLHFVKLHHAVAFGIGLSLIACCFLIFGFDHMHFWTVALTAVAYGIALGLLAQVFPLLILRLFGLQRLNSAFGYIGAGEGIGALIWPAFAGAAFDISGNYKIPIFVVCALLVVSGFLCIPIHIYLQRKDKHAVIAKDNDCAEKRTDMTEEQQL